MPQATDTKKKFKKKKKRTSIKPSTIPSAHMQKIICTRYVRKQCLSLAYNKTKHCDATSDSKQSENNGARLDRAQ